MAECKDNCSSKLMFKSQNGLTKFLIMGRVGAREFFFPPSQVDNEIPSNWLLCLCATC